MAGKLTGALDIFAMRDQKVMRAGMRNKELWPNEMKLSKSKANYMIFTDYIRFSRIDNLDKPP